MFMYYYIYKSINTELITECSQKIVSSYFFKYSHQETFQANLYTLKDLHFKSYIIFVR
jgi:hypothetical protein